MKPYNASANEKKWQKRWRESGVFKANLKSAGSGKSGDGESGGGKSPRGGKSGSGKSGGKGKYYNLTMFPYPSGDRLHIGHWYNYGPVDTWGRYMKMRGYDVFQPMGFDSFGLPAENYAIKTGVHPAETTRANIDKMKEQIAAIGGMYDLDVDVETSSPEYYRWTQWLFLKLYEKGLAYRKKAPVNWCDSCQTVLANEQVEDGACERCKNEVVQKDLTQWFFKITDYAEELLKHDGIDWPEKTIAMQKNWIGRSEGINIEYEVEGADGMLLKADGEDVTKIACYTTRPDTNFGATFIVVAPESSFVKENFEHFEDKKAVEKYIKAANRKTELERIAEGGKKTGEFTGLYAVNNLNGRKMPIYVSDFVLATVGTGCVVGVPGHDIRDFEFAIAKGLEVIRVVIGTDGDKSQITKPEQVQEEAGTMINSDFLDGMEIMKAKEAIKDHIEAKGCGKRVVNYRLRDWLISRQRYWGAPIPVIYCEACGESGKDGEQGTPAEILVPEADLPVVHPHLEDYVPKGQSPLAKSEDFVNVSCPKCGGAAKREVDTMDTFVCSSWYFLRYPDSHNEKAPWSKESADKWMPVDMYIGGPEHACMHLLYARFIHKALRDMGYVDCEEPFTRLVHQGMITKDGAKMSKSKGNTVAPDAFVERFGSDVFRMYLMFMGPFTEGGDWSDQGITGVARFVDRFFRMMQIGSDVEADGKDEEMERLVHKTVDRASKAIDTMCFNIAIAALMELTNEALKKGLNLEQREMLVKVLAPLAPHLAEELWEMMGHEWKDGAGSVFLESWPEADPKMLVENMVTYAVQVNGKLRGTIELGADVSKEDAIEAARGIENVAKYLAEGKLMKEIFVPGKIVGFVVK